MLTVIGQIDHAYLLVESSTEGEDHNVTSIVILRKNYYPMEQAQIKRQSPIELEEYPSINTIKIMKG